MVKTYPEYNSDLLVGREMLGIAELTSDYFGYWAVRNGFQSASLHIFFCSSHILLSFYTPFGSEFSLLVCLVFIFSFFLSFPLFFSFCF